MARSGLIVLKNVKKWDNLRACKRMTNTQLFLFDQPDETVGKEKKHKSAIRLTDIVVTKLTFIYYCTNTNSSSIFEPTTDM